MKETTYIERMVWCEYCKSVTEHIIQFKGRDKQNTNNILFVKFCNIYLQREYEKQKFLWEEKHGTEFAEEGFFVETIVESIPEKDWIHLVKNDY